MTVACQGLKVKVKELAEDRDVWQELVVIGVVYSDRMTEDSDKWRKYVHGVWPTLGSRTSKERNRTEQRKNKKKCPRDTKYVAVYCLKEIELENRQMSTSMRVWVAILCINELCLFTCVLIIQSQKDVEKEQEAQLRAKFPGMKGPGTSALLQKRLAQKV